MSGDENDRGARLVDARGRPARQTADTACPRCGKDAKARVASAGFGTPHPVCPCGYEWFDEVFRG